MHAYVYKSQRKADTYVYLAERDDFDTLPEPLRRQLGPLQFVLELALTPQRRLAREDPAVVRRHLVTRGYHLQLARIELNDRKPDGCMPDGGTLDRGMSDRGMSDQGMSDQGMSHQRVSDQRVSDHGMPTARGLDV